MLRTKTEGDRVEVTSAPGWPRKVFAFSFLALGLFGLGWLVTSLGAKETRHFTCDRAPNSCAVQSGDDVSLLKLSSLKAITLIEEPVAGIATAYRMVVVLDDGSNRAIGRPAIHDKAVADYTRAAAEIRGFLDGEAPSIKVSWTYRQSLIEVWPQIALTGGGILIGVWLLVGWQRRHTVIDRGANTVHTSITGPLRPSRERRVKLADTRRVLRAGRRVRPRLELEIDRGKKLRLTDGDLHGFEEAEKAVAALIPKAPPPPVKGPPAKADKAEKRPDSKAAEADAKK